MKTKTTSKVQPLDPATSAKPLPRKLGPDHSETAAKPRKHHNNFKQSRDLREDRGIRQLKSSPKNSPQTGA
jgi:hypothetical protein